MNILVTGLTSSALGGMEFHNLGNFTIAEPLFREMRKVFPDARIATTIQMSDRFYSRHGLVGLKNPRFWTYRAKTGLRTAVDALCLSAWWITRRKVFLRSPMLHEISIADLVVDFSGDIYGDNANWAKFLEANSRLVFALVLKKKTAMLVGSPGPFSSLWRQWIAKRILPRLDLVTNREPLSTQMLAYIGVKGDHIQTAACPSVLFEKVAVSDLSRNDDYEILFLDNRPILGIILCGWNMPVAPFDRWPREDWEYEPFRRLVLYIKNNTDYRVCLMAHQNATDGAGTLMSGNDHRIIAQLIDTLDEDFDGSRVFTLSGLYDAAQSKTIIGAFQLLISGRIHGAVQGLSQCIPTAIIDYGHEPKAHKLRGFGRVYGVDDYVAEPGNAEYMIKVTNKLIENKQQIETMLTDRIPHIQKTARDGIENLSELIGRDIPSKRVEYL